MISVQTQPAPHFLTLAQEQIRAVQKLNESDTEKLTKMKVIFENTLAAAKEKLKTSNPTLVQLLKDENAEQAKLITNTIAAKHILQKEVDVLTNALAILKEQTQPALDRFQARYDEMMATSKSQLSKLLDMETQIKGLDLRTTEIGNQATQLKEGFGTLQTTVTTVSDKTKTLETQAEKFARECTELQSNLEQLNQQTKQLNAKSDSLTRESETLQGAFNGLQGRTEGQEQATTQIQKDYLHLQTTFKTLDRETSTLKTSFTDIGTKFNSLKTLYNELGDHTGALKSKYDAISLEYNKLNTQFNSLGTDTGHLKTVTDQMRVNYEALKGDFSRMRSHTHELQTKVDLLEDRNKLVKERNQFLKSSDKLSTPVSFTVGTSGMSLSYYLGLSYLNVVLLGFLAFGISYYIVRQFIKHLRAAKLAQIENDYLAEHANKTPRAAFEFAKSNEQMRKHRFYGSIWGR